MASALPTSRPGHSRRERVVYLFGTFVSLLYRSLGDVEQRVQRNLTVVVLDCILKSSRKIRIQIVLGDYGGSDALGAVDFVPSPGGFIGFGGSEATVGHAFFSSFVSSSSTRARSFMMASDIAPSERASAKGPWATCIAS